MGLNERNPIYEPRGCQVPLENASQIGPPGRKPAQPPARSCSRAAQPTAAMHSISTRAPSARPLPATVERAGGLAGK